MPRYKFFAELPAHDVKLDSPAPEIIVTVPYGYSEFVVEAPSLKDAITKLEDHFFGVDYLGEVA